MYAHRSATLQPKGYLSHTPGGLYRVKSMLSSVSYHLKTIWLFTVSDFKTIVGPTTMFAVLQQLGSPAFDTGDIPQTQRVTPVQIIKVILWTWLNLLPLDIDNQRWSVDEDQFNKPWRPLPAKRVTSQQATRLLLLVYPVAIAYGIITGAYSQSLGLLCFGYWYNDLGGAKSSWITRNFLNACGITCFLSGALMVMIQHPAPTVMKATTEPFVVDQTRSLQTWIVIVWAVIFTSTQAQDMADQEGDAFIHRKTMPLVLGDGVARWTIAVPVLFWSWFCLRYWSVPLLGCILPFMLGGLVAWRTLSYREVKDDKKTYKLWNLWLATLFTLPLQRILLA